MSDRVHRFLSRRKKKKPWSFSDAPEPRQQGKVGHPMPRVYNALWLGLLSNEPTLRDVELMTQDLGGWGRSLVPEPISDTTLDTESRRLSEPYLLDKLVRQVREMQRGKMLAPFGLPCGVATVDGKNLAKLEHDADGRAQPRTSENAKWHDKGQPKTGKPYYLAPVLRAGLTSAMSKPALYQLSLGPHQGEADAFVQMVQGMHQAYGRSGMIGIIDGDAGLTSLKNADAVDDLGYGYVFGLKGNQPELFAEAKALLEPFAESRPPEVETDWERRGAKRIRRRLWRTDEMRGMVNSVGCWKHLRQTWLVRQETTLMDGTHLETEDRYFISSVLWNYLKPVQILLLVRNHWGIENDAFNSLDLQWREDHGPWCTMGNAVWGVGLLRLMAYNLVQHLRKRHLRRKDEEGRWRVPPSWRSVFRKVQRVLDTAPLGTMGLTAGV
jgi:hypothetical protein